MKKIIKNKYIKKIIVAMSLVSVMSVTVPVDAAEIKNLDARGAIVVEKNSGKILYGKNIDEVLGIASMSKMVTQYLILEAIHNGEVTWDTQIPISPALSKMSINYELSNVPLRANVSYPLKDLYEAISIYSANAAITAVGIYLGGSEDAWVQKMQETVESMGITDARLVNPSGLPYRYNIQKNKNLSEDDENSMSPRSVAILAQRLITDYPEILDTASIQKKTFQPGTVDETKMSNYNLLLPGLLFGRDDVIGLKTGTSALSGASVTAVAIQNNTSVISVVVGSSAPLKRFEESSRLLDYIFTTYETIPFIKKGDSAQQITPYPVVDGKDQVITFDYDRDYYAAVPKGASPDQIIVEFTPNPERVNEENQIQAPITKGENLGYVTITTPGKDLGYLQEKDNTIPVVASYDVEEVGHLTKVWRQIKVFFAGIRDSIKDFFSGIFNSIKNFFHPSEEPATN
ncbi:D-Ala-D-Ala carboxypeptidase A. Serine peptidase. MEROPS family S11 [Granulicatella balaenopterae]|uniref:serine-type D-Ala-D-Ala carboxypeptidase n=1 Tax=Granulicatella balaenopterae TaxID=137733 RepID=A0A1H9MAI5_9LACT|nr:serine hydrolase [Granulicatella balaenopterae]SER20467.1 D-Ala-D-Ala carboxypeptidase A. Serine peptidase. MEROPS family S11 [Granulicatella balaenopterae]